MLLASAWKIAWLDAGTVHEMWSFSHSWIQRLTLFVCTDAALPHRMPIREIVPIMLCSGVFSLESVGVWMWDYYDIKANTDEDNFSHFQNQSFLQAYTFTVCAEYERARSSVVSLQPKLTLLAFSQSWASVWNKWCGGQMVPVRTSREANTADARKFVTMAAWCWRRIISTSELGWSVISAKSVKLAMSHSQSKEMEGSCWAFVFRTDRSFMLLLSRRNHWEICLVSATFTVFSSLESKFTTVCSFKCQSHVPCGEGQWGNHMHYPFVTTSFKQNRNQIVN